MVFVPVLYAVWSDAVLTPTEINALHSLIKKQVWLTEAEREFLIAHFNPSDPPTAEELKRWLLEIRKVDISQATSLASIGNALAATNGRLVTSEAQTALLGVEETLGLIPQEVVYTFYPEHRKSLTQEQATQHNFNVDLLAKQLEGDKGALIAKVKAILSDPEFAYLDTDSLALQREKVLQWAKHLAGQGFGSIAYPKEYGGQDDMAAYFTIMETLSYHDLSLVVKFGVQFGLWGMSVYFLGTEKHHKKYLKDI